MAGPLAELAPLAAASSAAVTGMRSTVRARRLRAASVRTTAAGITPPTTDSTIASSPAYSPLVIRTRLPTLISGRPVIACRLMETVLLAAAAARSSADGPPGVPGRTG